MYFILFYLSSDFAVKYCSIYGKRNMFANIKESFDSHTVVLIYLQLKVCNPQKENKRHCSVYEKRCIIL